MALTSGLSSAFGDSRHPIELPTTLLAFGTLCIFLCVDKSGHFINLSAKLPAALAQYTRTSLAGT